MECVVHYKNQSSYSELKKLTDTNIKRIEEAKVKRLGFGGVHVHNDQTSKIPEVIDANKHGIHLTPCYKRYTVILGDKNFAEKNITKKSDRLSSPPPSTLLYPKECNLCLKFRVQYKNKKYEPYKVVTTDAERKIKMAAKIKDQDLYAEINHLDLIAKEFKVHHHCYKNYTRDVPKSSTSSASSSSSSSTNIPYEKGNFEAVKHFLSSEVIGCGKSVPMKQLHNIYGLATDDSRYRNKLKERIKKEYKQQLLFLDPGVGRGEVVISADCLDGSSLTENNVILSAAKILKNSITEKFKNLDELEWPPTPEELSKEKRKPPKEIYTFLEALLSGDSKRRELSENVERLVESFSNDLVHAVTRGKVIQKKHVNLGLGLHNLSGSRKLVEIIHKLGHCISYNLICEIETAQAESMIKASQEGLVLPVKPTTPLDTVFTHYWVDNFDVTVDRINGGGSVNTTHLVAYQERRSEQTIIEGQSLMSPVSKKKSRKIFIDDVTVQIKPVNKIAEPKQLQSKNSEIVEVGSKYQRMFTLWLYVRKCKSLNQTVPIFKGWALNQKTEKQIIKTVETYLPPITSKVTDFETIQKYFSQLQNLSASVNMPFVNITLDIGAAINAFKTIWSHKDEYKNVIIHVGCFHFLKENFQVIGLLIADSGFEDIIYQSGLCTSGSLQAILSGSHYNRAWSIHLIIAEAMERLLLARFLAEKKPNIPDALAEYLVNQSSEIDVVLNQGSQFFELYESFRKDIRDGSIGKTAQFWLLYLDLMRAQILIHEAVHDNNFQLLLNGWKVFLPMYFAMNKHNYARYGSYYVNQMSNLDDYPGMEEHLGMGIFSVQAQDNYAIRTSTDQRGEQTINRDAKTVGGIKGFASNEINVLKWCMNRPLQAEHLNELLNLAGMRKTTRRYKPVTISEVKKSEKNILKVIDVLENEYLNPFGTSIDPEMLVNLSSGCSKKEDVNDLLNIWTNGQALSEKFSAQRILSKEKLIHDPIPKNKIPKFQGPKLKLSTPKKSKIIDANRNIIGKLLSISAKYQKPIDFENVFRYPLYSVPLNLAYPDGSKRESQKSKLIEVIIPTVPEYQGISLDQDHASFVIDLIAQIRICTMNCPGTFKEFINKFLQSIPKGFKRVDLIADTYRMISIKNQERTNRGKGSKIIIGSIHSKLPRDLNKFMENGENKTALIELFFNYIIENKESVLQLLQTQQVVLSGDDWCFTVTSDDAFANDLKSNQEEADTKVVLHTLHILKDSQMFVVLRSPSGDTDITVLALSLIADENRSRVYYDYGNAKSRRGTWLSNINLQENYRSSLIGFHAFTGNDYVSSFFRKGKQWCWKKMIAEEIFIQCFKDFGDSWVLSDEMKVKLELFVCKLFSSKKVSINEVRLEMFTKKHAVQNKVIDLSILPPCQSSLLLHMDRANYVAAMWKRSMHTQVDTPDISNHGWNTDGSIHWVDETFPEDLIELILEDDENSDDETDEIYESDNDSNADDLEF